MNFKSFYTNTEARIIDTILSIWVTGDPKMQKYIRDILSNEKLLAKPVFQNMFPWEPHEKILRNLDGIFTPDFIQKIDSIQNEEYRFPADRKPYAHQVESWTKSLIEKKSILVTTGTGSGKTESFMLPVLQDIYTHKPNSIGVNAIFLYPLNALIGSQKKRMHAWCQALGKIKYGIYNSSTLESVPSINQAEAYPEIISRSNIRNTPPQVLFTNPTMLEYMLVRDKDTALLNNSRGQLRWILLDEAHTLTGSKAGEMALLIRRVIDAFCVDINSVRFAVTSATVGHDNDTSLKQFMADLCGISISSIEIIKGKRILPDFDTNILLNNNLKVETAINSRNYLFHESCLDTIDIGKITGEQDFYKQVGYIDTLSDISDATQSFLPVRGHFFVRNISGLYACTNPNCNIHQNVPNNIIGSLTTISKKSCDCGYPLLELIACQTCGNYMMEGEKVSDFIKQSSNQNNDLFYVENEEEEEENGLNQNLGSSRIVLVREFNDKPFVTADLFPVQINESGSISYESSGPLFELHDTESCPFCGDSLAHPFHFRLSAAFINRMMSDVILEQTNNAHPVTNEMLWSGKKYLSFTDSRQGTAKISALINIDSETFWLRSQVYHSLCKKIKDNQPLELTEEDRRGVLQELEKTNFELEAANLPPLIAARKREQIKELEAMLKIVPPSTQKYRITWREMLDILNRSSSEYYSLFYQNIGGNLASQGKEYLSSLLYNEFARRLPRERSLENLGMVNLTYAGLDRLVVPEIATTLGITNGEWKNLTKIALDFIIRYKYHYSITDNIKHLASIKHRSYAVFPSNTTITNVLKWPVFDRHRNPTNRLSLLICAGLGYSDLDLIDAEKEDQINDLLIGLWVTIRTHFLKMDGLQGGYKLDLEEKAAFELTDRIWLCPVKKRLIDTTFRGYSPWIKGRLIHSNLEAFKVGDPVYFPIFPYPFNLDEGNVYNTEPTIDWINKNELVDELKKKGLWNSLHERIINFKPLYLAGEHSAQQQQTRLQQLEEKFQDGKINILSCSTTMEMGVDIGGISAVVMSNVPPSPANYLQRTGRAGRRRENKALAFTICAANPIGINVIANPKWALNHKISAPMLAFNSKAVVQRHLNAFMFGKFVQHNLTGISIKETIDNFFFRNVIGSQASPSQMFLSWLLVVEPNSLSTAIKKLIENTPLSSYSIFAIINNVYSNFEFLLSSTQQKNERYDKALKSLLDMAGYTEDSPAHKAINYQKNQFLRKNLLGYLSEEGFLPAGGIPTGVVEFNNIGIEDIRNERQTTKQLPSYHITRAISEYAPGMNIVIDGWTYRSAGISLKNNWGGETSKHILQHCTFCGYEHIVQQEVNIPTNCPHCANNALRGLNPTSSYTEIIEPVGFSVDLFEEKSREIDSHSNVQYVQPLLIGVEPWSDASHPVFEYRDSKENAEIIYYNYGEGEGYSVCLECGRAETNPDALRGHTRLRGGRDTNNSSICNGNENPFAIRRNVMLVGRFQTDFFEMRCKDNGHLINNETVLYSIGQAICKCLTTYLGIEEQEIDFGIKRYRGFLSVFLFDTAKGGAGYVAQCGNYIEEICCEALVFLQNCTCNSACTKCLIDRRSQFHLDKLDRFSAIEWLQKVVDIKVPDDVIVLLPNHPKRIVGTIKNDWARLQSKKQLQEVWMLVDWSTIDNWNTEDFVLLNQMKLSSIPIHLVFRGMPQDLTLEQKLTLVQCKMWSTLHYTDEFDIGGMELIGRVQLSNGLSFDYFTNQYQAQLDENWGVAANNFIYKQDATNIWALPTFEIRFDEMQTDISEVLIPSPDSPITSFGIFDEFYKLLPNIVQQRMAQRLQGRNINFIYSDRYLFKPFGCQLLFHFVMAMKRQFGFNIIGLTFLLQNTRNPVVKSNTYIFEDFEDGISRKQFLERIGQECGIPNIEVIVADNLQHFRFLNIEPEGESSITIRPDAGIEHGWFATKKYIHTDDLSGKTELTIQQKLNKELLYTLVFNHSNNA